MDIGGQKKHVMTYLSDFLFPPERARAQVASLSGGERNRLLLARLFTCPANVLVLDEPTNDLDIETLELLEALLQDYDGTIFLVSHDRAFLDNVVTQVIVFEGSGKRPRMPEATRIDALRAGAQFCTSRGGGRAEIQRQAKRASAARVRAKLSYSESRELAALPDQIAALEAEQQVINAQLANSETYRTRATEVGALQRRHAAIEEELVTLLQRWEKLEAKQAS